MGSWGGRHLSTGTNQRGGFLLTASPDTQLANPLHHPKNIRAPWNTGGGTPLGSTYAHTYHGAPQKNRRHRRAWRKSPTHSHAPASSRPASASRRINVLRTHFWRVQTVSTIPRRRDKAVGTHAVQATRPRSICSTASTASKSPAEGGR